MELCMAVTEGVRSWLRSAGRDSRTFPALSVECEKKRQQAFGLNAGRMRLALSRMGKTQKILGFVSSRDVRTGNMEQGQSEDCWGPALLSGHSSVMCPPSGTDKTAMTSRPL